MEDIKDNCEDFTLMDILSTAVSTYFCLPVEIANPILLKNEKDKKKYGLRYNKYSKNEQLNTRSINADLMWRREYVIKNEFDLIGVSFYDLYPQSDWNFVFGEANMGNGVGVFSFARYLPGFGSDNFNNNITISEINDKLNNDILYQKLFLCRSLKILFHEIGHTFGLNHCIYFNCCMNGSNNLDEFDNQSMILCPICLRKLHFGINYRRGLNENKNKCLTQNQLFNMSNIKHKNNICYFNIKNRYNNLLYLYKCLGLDKQIEWIQNKLPKQMKS